MTKRGRKLLQMAAGEADLRYGPEIADLIGLAGEARATFRQGVKQEKGIKGLLVGDARSARPKVKKDYAQSDRTRKQSAGIVNKDLAGLSSAADPFKAIAAIENAGAKDRIGQSRAEALHEFVSRESDAKAGYAGNVRALKQQRAADLDKVHTKQGQVQAERGLFLATTFQKLVDAAHAQDIRAAANRERAAHDRATEAAALAGLGVRRASQRETGRHNRAGERTARKNANTSRRNSNTSRYRATHPKKKSGLLTTAGRNRAIDYIEYARQYFRIGSRKGYSHPKIIDVLVAKKNIPRAYVAAAQDLETRGGLTHGTVRRLHGRRFKIGKTYRVLKGGRRRSGVRFNYY